MADTPDFEDLLGESLDVIDRNLARSGVAPADRPLQAARYFVRYRILKIRVGDDETEPGDFRDYWGAEWFKVIYARTFAWYNDRYGDAMATEGERIVKGCTQVLDTLFAMNVPVVTRRPGKPDETIWVCFPCRVEDDEDALAWIVDGPNIATLPRSDGLKARRLANEVASAIRAIQTSLATVQAATPRVGELRDAILPHLERAALQIARARPEDLKHAQWDLQMACELVLKLIGEQRAGSFPESHDLYYLCDQLPPGPSPFKRELLKNIPNWERMAEWRYGGGKPISGTEAFSRYRSALRIVQSAAAAADHVLHIGGGSIEIAKAPFLYDDPEMYRPRRESPTQP